MGENLQGEHEERPGKSCLEHSDERGGRHPIPGVDYDTLFGTLFILDALSIMLTLVFEQLLFMTKLLGKDGRHM